MVRVTKEMVTSGAECDTCARRFNHRNFLVGHVITVDKEWMVLEDSCFIQMLNGGKPWNLPVIRQSPKLSQERRKTSRAFCQKFYFISCLCNMGTNRYPCFACELGNC